MKKLNVFQPFGIGSTALYDWCGKAAKSDKTIGVLDNFMSKDPGATDWSSLGLICPIEDGRPVHDLDGTARVLCYQFNDRILPGSVRDEKLRDEIKRISEKEDRVLNKKEFAQIKEDVEFALLPKAFIRRSLVPVMVFPHHILIFTSSAKKCEDIMISLGIIATTRKIEFDWHTIDMATTVGHFLSQMARYGGIDTDANFMFATLNAAVFKGGDKRAIRIKERDIDSGEVQSILKQDGYSVTELLMSFVDPDDEEVLRFTLTDRFVIKGIKLSDVTMGDIQGDTADKHATTWLMAKTCILLLKNLISVLNEVESDDEL